MMEGVTFDGSTGTAATVSADSAYVAGSIASTLAPVPVSEDDGGRPFWLELIINTTVWIICLVTIVGNSLVILVFILDERVRSKVSNLYIFNLALADFFVGINSLVFNNLYRISWVWHFGEHVCKIWLILDWTTATVAIWAIVLISYDRYVLVTKGLEYDKIQTRRKFNILSALLWTICLLRYAVPNIAYDFWLGYPSYDYSVECGVIFEYLLWVEILTMCVNIATPVLLIGYFNVVIFLNIMRRSRGLPRNWGSNSVAPAPASTVSTIDGATDSSTTTGNDGGEMNSRGNVLPRVVKKEGTSDLRKLRRSAITLSLIVGVSAACWIPFHVSVFVQLAHVPIGFTLVSSTYYIWWFNSTCNPFIYVATNPGIRRGIVSIIRLGRS